MEMSAEGFKSRDEMPDLCTEMRREADLISAPLHLSEISGISGDEMQRQRRYETQSRDEMEMRDWLRP
jgi:hypothetical protein